MVMYRYVEQIDIFIKYVDILAFFRHIIKTALTRSASRNLRKPQIRERQGKGYRVTNGLPGRWSAPTFSPYLDGTGSWS
jgi:hypothetical protein